MSPGVLIVWNFFTGAWNGIGPLVGVFVGAWLSRSWQRKQSVLDSKKAEYRELISCLSQSMHSIMNNSGSSVAGGRLTSGEELRDIDWAESRGYNIISDRVFIADVMTREKVRERWLTVVKQQADRSQFWAEW